MTAKSKPNKKVVEKSFVSSRAWAEDRIKYIKVLQDEYLDMYVSDKNEATQMLKLLSDIQKMLERKL